jgi:hypothetical protein
MGTAANGCGQANFWFYFLGMRLQRGLKNTGLTSSSEH